MYYILFYVSLFFNSATFQREIVFSYSILFGRCTPNRHNIKPLTFGKSVKCPSDLKIASDPNQLELHGAGRSMDAIEDDLCYEPQNWKHNKLTDVEALVPVAKNRNAVRQNICFTV